MTDSAAGGSATILPAFNAGWKPALLAEVRSLGGSPNLLARWELNPPRHGPEACVTLPQSANKQNGIVDVVQQLADGCLG